jgi:hypothetical protein
MEQLTRSGINEHAPVKAWEFLLMFLLLALSGNPFFTQKLPLFISVLSVISLYYILTNYSGILHYRTLFIFIFFVGYEALHALIFHLDYSATIIKLFLVLLFAFTVVNFLKTRFLKVFLHTMYVICIISFVFTVLCYVPGVGKALYNLAATLFPLKKDFKDYSTPTLIVYTFLPEFFNGTFSYARNAGIFWESGAFAVYLNIALCLKYYTKRIENFGDLFDKQSTVYIIAICSAASTMGFLAMVTVMTFYCFQFKSNLKYIGVILIFTVSALAFSSLDFLGSKIAEQLSVSSKSNNRFGSALLDLKDIGERPFLGWSRRIEVLFKTNVYSAKSHRPNGLTNFLRSYGLLYFTVYFYLVYQSFKKIGYYYNTRKTTLALIGILLLWIVSFSELIFDEAFLKSLLFLSMIYQPSKQNIPQRPHYNRRLTLDSSLQPYKQ